MNSCIGLDFGTTNSAAAIATDDGVVSLAAFTTPRGTRTSARSVLFFDPEDARPGRRTQPHVGGAAIERSIEVEGEGRFIQSTKSWLASRSFESTDVFGHRWRLEELIAAVVGMLRDAVAPHRTGPVRVVAGRPVQFARADDPTDDAYAESRLRAALALAGFDDVTFELEPIGAAWHYAHGLDHDELVLIGDFGGGTSDFTLVKVGPRAWADGRERRRDAVLGTDGVGLAGDAFDAAIIRNVIASAFGKGTDQRSPFGKVFPLPGWVFVHLERWHQLSMLGTPGSVRRLESILREAVHPELFGALVHVVRHDLGFALYRSVQAAKAALSRDEEARLVFVDDDVCVDAKVTRADFERWIAPELGEIQDAVTRLLDRTGVAPHTIDRVFLTGGTSFVPAVRGLFADRFGAEKLASGDELTSVARGLALSGL